MLYAATEKKKLSFAEMAAAGTSITVSSLPSTNHASTPILEDKISQSPPSEAKYRISSISSNTTISTDGNSTSSSSSENVSHKSSHKLGKVPSSVPKPAAAPVKNPWKTQLVKKNREESISSMNGISKNLPTPAESKGMRTIAVALAHVHIVVDDGPNETKTNEMDPGDKGSPNKESENVSTSANVVEDTKPSARPSQQRQMPVEKKECSDKNPDATEESKGKSNDKLRKDPSTTVKKEPKDEYSKNQRVKPQAKKSISASQQNKSSNGKKLYQQSKNKGTKNKKQSKRKNQKKNQANINASMYTPTLQELAAYKNAAVAQVNYFFSTDELIKNIYMRNQMDVEGYLPAAIVFNFPSVLSFSVPYYDLLEALKESKIVEVDYDNECLRLKGTKEEYKKWLFPNGDGTFGCPKWFIPQEESKEDIADEEKTKPELVHKFGEEQTEFGNMEVVHTGKEEKKDSNSESDSA